MGVRELRRHTRRSVIRELEGAETRKQVGHNRFWKRETQQAGRCRLSLGARRGGMFGENRNCLRKEG